MRKRRGMGRRKKENGEKKEREIKEEKGTER